MEDGREYEILLDGDRRPPAPWINVISNGNFGFHVSESGAGYTWFGNSRENKLSPWSNDPVIDPATEAIYILDELTGKVMTPVSLGRTDRGVYRVRHGFGYSKFFHTEEDLEQELLVFTPQDEPVKLWELKLTNHSDYERYFSLTYYIEWVLGVDRNLTNPYIVTAYDGEHEYLHAKSVYAYEYRNHTAFIFSSEMIKGYTGDKNEFFGPGGNIRDPEGLKNKLSFNTGVCYDSCGVIQVSVAIKPGECKSIVFGLGQSDKLDEIRAIRAKYRDVSQIGKELAKTTSYWESIIGKVRVKSQDRAMDIMMNGWLLYQTIACRLKARAAFYQCGGAIGYRDQLQDTLALVYHDPLWLKDQILVAASRQFEEGDVQHWWHPPLGVGVRTRITDDLLWLPYAVAFYIKTTGDHSILKEKVHYIKGEMLEPGVHDMMVTPAVSELEESIYLHCKRAIDTIRLGGHGLPLIGGGDWNDGMNMVGIEGEGESCWLGWFIYTILGEFIPLSRHEGEDDYADALENLRKSIQKNMEAHAWDGEWYLRAFYDDGTKIGSRESDECKIDSISQSWSIISGGAKKTRAQKAFDSAWRYLVIEREGVSLLLNPPFDKTHKNPGYIKDYYPGIRENGGQYSHAASWLAIAATVLGEKDRAQTLFRMLNPINSTASHRDALKYEKEPYVMSADISYMAPYTGRGGWSWYTGSSAWLYQGLLRWFLGLRLEAGKLIVEPGVPSGFGEYSLSYRHGSSEYIIRVADKKTASPQNGELLMKGNSITLEDDGKRYCYLLTF